MKAIVISKVLLLIFSGPQMDCNFFTYSVQCVENKTILERDGFWNLGEVVNKFITGTRYSSFPLALPALFRSLTCDPSSFRRSHRLSVFERHRTRSWHPSDPDVTTTLLYFLRSHRHRRRSEPRALASPDRARAQPAQSRVRDRARIPRQVSCARGLGERRRGHRGVRLPRWRLSGKVLALSSSVFGDGAGVTRKQPAREAQADLWGDQTDVGGAAGATLTSGYMNFSIFFLTKSHYKNMSRL
jgi:hypothetical protein